MKDWLDREFRGVAAGYKRQTHCRTHWSSYPQAICPFPASGKVRMNFIYFFFRQKIMRKGIRFPLVMGLIYGSCVVFGFVVVKRHLCQDDVSGKFMILIFSDPSISFPRRSLIRLCVPIYRLCWRVCVIGKSLSFGKKIPTSQKRFSVSHRVAFVGSVRRKKNYIQGENLGYVVLTVKVDAPIPVHVDFLDHVFDYIKKAREKKKTNYKYG